MGVKLTVEYAVVHIRRDFDEARWRLDVGRSASVPSVSRSAPLGTLEYP